MKARAEEAGCIRCGNTWTAVVFDDGKSLDYDCPKCGTKTVIRPATMDEVRAAFSLIKARDSMKARHCAVLDDFIEHANECGRCREGIEIEGEWANINTAKMCPVGQALGVPAGRVVKQWGVP